jgi:hypothetical protein
MAPQKNKIDKAILSKKKKAGGIFKLTSKYTVKL